MYASNKELSSRVYKELKKPNNKTDSSVKEWLGIGV